MSGLYIVIEGIEGGGKSTTMAAVAERLRRVYSGEVLTTRHPGATPLGAHLRVLNKNPELIDPNIKLDPLASQMLMVIDNCSFVSDVLDPALDRDAIVLADRSNFISSIAYGVADGLSLDQIDRLFSLVKPPKADRLYVLQLPWEEAAKRIQARGGDLDRFERKGDKFFKQVEQVYDSLVSGGPELTAVVSHSVNLENIRYVDASADRVHVVDEIVNDVCKLLLQYR